MAKITKSAIDKIVPDRTREIYLWDDSLSGYGVRMQPTGKASFIVKYRTHLGLARKIALGRVGTITPDEARRLAVKTLAEVAQGGDPSSDRRAARKAISIGDLADLFVRDMKPQWKPNTYQANTSQIERHIKPLIGRTPAVALSYADVLKFQSDVTAGKTAVERKGRGGSTRGGKGVATRAIVILGAILNYGIRHEVLTKNVTQGIKKSPIRKRTRYLSLAEISALGNILNNSPEEPEAGLSAIRFLLLTGFRRMECLTLKAEYCRKSQGVAFLPDTKTGEQVRVIGQKAFDAIELLDRGFIFPAERGGGHFVGLPKVLKRVCKAAGIKGVSPHDLRHTFAATAASMGYSELTIAGLLGHASGSVTGRYAHVADFALLMAADAISEVISRALAGDDMEDYLQARARLRNRQLESSSLSCSQLD